LMFVAFLFSVVLRSLSRRLWRGITPTERTVIVGTGKFATATRTKMSLLPDVHADVVALYPELDTHSGEEGDDWWHSVDRILITKPVDESRMREILATRFRRRVKVGILSPGCSLSDTAVHPNSVSDHPVVEYRTREVSRPTLLLKRSFDLMIGSVLLVLSAPFAVLIALTIMLDSPGSPIYLQRRAGKKGEHFYMLKFRTMVRDAERQLQELVAFESLSEPVFKLQDDPRVTRVGRILRRWSLDELPQLANVAAGHMSLVGPRPEQVEIVERYTEEQRIRLEVRPGLTGPMQVYGRGELNFQERLAVERDYIENVSLRRDLHILRMTIPAVLGGRGAF
jgi:lipopolysaccharide/colanic/teichoic acid biosynthesis glycosyltransferase